MRAFVRFRRPLLLSFTAVSSVALVACGGGDDELVVRSSRGASGASGVGGRAGASGAAAGASGAAGLGGASGAGGLAVGGAAGLGGGGGTAGVAGSTAGGGAGVAGSTTGGAAGAGTGGTGGTGTGGTGAAGASGGSACGKTCTEGVCVGETCCAPNRACGSLCCGDGSVCSFGACVTPGKTCLEPAECAANEICDLSLGKKPTAPGPMCSGGTSLPEGRCIPRAPQCAAGQSPDPAALTCVSSCEFKPPTIPFTPTVAYAWGGDVAGHSTDVMMAPIVVQLDDDDCDGTITNRDLPEIVFTSFTDGDPTKNGTLRALTVKNGVLVEKWHTAAELFPGGGVAGGNFDGKPGNEVVACLANGFVRAYDGATGAVLWTSDGPYRCSTPAIADLEHDGVKVIVEGAILRGSDGSKYASYATPWTGTFAIADINGDGFEDIVGSGIAFRGNGTILADTGLKGTQTCCGAESGPAVVDLDKDGKPEVVATFFESRTLAVWRFDTNGPGKAQIVRQGLDINGPIAASKCPEQLDGGGPVTAGDFDSDGFPDVALAGAVGYVVLNGKKLVDAAVPDAQTFLWAKETQDCSSAGTGSSLFDFNGDGKAEVIYADEIALHIYEGATGNVLFDICNTSRTLNEQPIVADVDNDGHADLVVVGNSYSGPIQCADGSRTSGIRVFSDPDKRWVRTRSVWNQHAYSVTNIEEDGSVPNTVIDNFKQPGLDNYRQNKQPGREFAAPDGVVSLALPTCAGKYALVAKITNVGESAIPAGAVVGFYLGDPAGGSSLGKVSTKGILYPAQSELVTLDLASPPAGLLTGGMPFQVRFDDTSEPHPAWTECRTDNNTSKAFSGSCGKD